MVYVYQSRISELHEFIADARVAKGHRQEHYQLLLAQIFETQHISFINQFFKSSLTRLPWLNPILAFLGLGGQVKKRIVMLQKAKSKKIWKLKYLFLVPIITAMLFYSSCQNDGLEDSSNTIHVGDIENLTPTEESTVFTKLIALSMGEEDWIVNVKDKNSTITFSKGTDGSYILGPGNTKIQAQMSIESRILEEDFDFFDSQGQRPDLVQISLNENAVPFGLVEEVPIFPGCENEADQRSCFNNKIQEHIRKHFNYPTEAQELGIQGRVNIMFTIDQNGNVQNIRKRGPHELLEDEAKRIIERLPEMQPGKLKGKAVNVPYSIPISFKLQ